MTVATIEHSAESPQGAVSWSAVLAGATAAAALSLILLILGTGLGLSSVSPWSHAGISAQALGVSTILWLAFTQLAASGMGGYLAGRLRVRWSGLHGDEVYFRDTVHGFLAWGVASLATAAMLGAAVTSIVAGTAQMASTAMAPAATAAVASAAGRVAGEEASSGIGNTAPAYFVDSLFRSDGSVTPAPAASATASPAPAAEAPATMAPAAGQRERVTAEVGRIYAQSAPVGVLSQEDALYIGQLISRQTGLPSPEADKRANEVFVRMVAATREATTTAQETADKARSASARTALWLFVSVLFGAFVSSFMATLGGRHRDLP